MSAGIASPKLRSCLKWTMAATVIVLWVLSCAMALVPLQEQLQERFIDRSRRELTPEITNAMAFIDACAADIRETSPGNARVFEELSDFARAAAAKPPDALTRLKLIGRAIELRAHAAEAEPFNAVHRFVTADCFLLFGRPDMAQKQADIACRLRPKDPWMPSWLATRFAMNGELDRARTYYQMALTAAAQRGVPDTDPVILRARTWIEKGTHSHGKRATNPLPDRLYFYMGQW